VEFLFVTVNNLLKMHGRLALVAILAQHGAHLLG
jgi:hypothetical protein